MKEHPLGEKSNNRGSNCTSIDALIHASHKNGKRYLIPIEWKYTENYGYTDKSAGSEGKVRLDCYKKLIEESDFLNENALSYCWIEPFYQLMRQTLWVEQIIKKRVAGLEAEDYLHIHVVPAENRILRDKKYKHSGENMETTWRRCLVHPEKYILISPKELLGKLNQETEHIRYLQKRYWD